MEHAKKLVLVDPTNIDVRNVKRHYGILDQSISDVLNRRDIDERTKLQLYQAAVNKFLLNRQTVENELKEPVKVSFSEPITSVGQVEQIVSEAVNRITNVHKPAVEDTEEKAEDEKKEEEEEEEKSSGARALPSTFRKGKRSASRQGRQTKSAKERGRQRSLPRRSSRKPQEKLPSSWTFY